MESLSSPLSITFQCIEIFPLLILIPCSLLNLFLIWKSCVLHNNSKIILLSQSISDICNSVLFGLNNLFTLTYNFTINIGGVCINFGNLIGHILIFERTIATLFTNYYGKIKIPYLGILSILILMFLFILPEILTYDNRLNLISFVAVHLSLLFSIIELIVFSKITKYNKKMYSQFLNNNKSYKLNERYQQLENVYTGKQLAPSFFLHFINILCSNIVIIFRVYSQLPKEIVDQIVSFILIIHAFSKLGIEITVITFHPVLNKNLNKIFSSIFKRSNKINNENQKLQKNNKYILKCLKNFGNKLVRCAVILIIMEILLPENDKVNYTTIVAVHLSLLFSIIELIVFSKITKYNKRMYSQSLNNNKSYKLNERCQQLENVYTGKQLAPSFFFHFINILCSNIVIITTTYIQLPTEYVINLIAFILIIHAFSKLGIEITVITFHPVLNKNLNKIFSSIFKRSNKINNENQINKHKLEASKEQQIHFEMLEELWK
ncbi:hypothetical protein Mgra_00006848 [Meloidogyne graminicola]|uniref:Uncharacterized protein n=1 Tax=Meloidogyne graminicola TaxID=189291 RepID=A0A8S9ZKK1_9BILA|nr:hypothetical protein Mgra_00006848 [Meloidogyne graminicola]